MPRSLRIQSTAKPKSNLPGIHRLAAIFHLPGTGGPLRDHLEHGLDVEPGALDRNGSPSASPCTRPAMQIWFIILVSWPEPEGPSRRQAPGKGHDDGFSLRIGLGIAAAHHGELTPFSAPAWPPETGASMKAMPLRFAASAWSSRATSAEAVVLSDENRAGLHAVERTIRADRHGAKVVIIADAGKDEVLAGCGLFGVFIAVPPCWVAHASAFAKVRL